MNTNKFLLGGIIGGIANFLLGWLVWGILLMDFMKDHSLQTPGVFRGEDGMIWWALIVGNLAMGFLLSYILAKANANSVVAGAMTAAIAGLLISVSIDCMMYAQINLWGRKAMAADVAASVVVSAIVGAIIGWLNGRGTAKAA